MEPFEGIEPPRTDYETVIIAVRSKGQMVRNRRFELLTSVESGRHSTSELIAHIIGNIVYM